MNEMYAEIMQEINNEHIFVFFYIENNSYEYYRGWIEMARYVTSRISSETFGSYIYSEHEGCVSVAQKTTHLNTN